MSPEQAMKWLQVTADEGFPNYPLFEGDAQLDNLRKDPRLLHLWRSRSSSGSSSAPHCDYRRKLPETQPFPSAFSYLAILLKEAETEYAKLQ